MALTNQAGTLLGPLTTTWTMPESCSIYMPPCSTCGQGFRGQSCNAISDGRVQDNTACWPPVKPGISSPEWPFVGWGFYSPGIACPAGYMTACTAVYGQRPQWDTQFTLVSSETAVGCCPTGFACANINGNTCISTATSTPIPTAFCDGTKLIDSGLETFPHVVTITQTDTGGVNVEASTIEMVLYAPMFQINFQSSDLPASTTTTTSTTLSTSSTAASRTTSSSSQQTTTSAADNSTETKSSGGLSNGAKVGLGVGIGLGVAFLLAFAAFIYYYRRSKKARVPLGSELPNNEVSEAAETPKIKKAPGQVYEMGDYYAPAELPGDNNGGEYQQGARRYG